MTARVERSERKAVTARNLQMAHLTSISQEMGTTSSSQTSQVFQIAIRLGYSGRAYHVVCVHCEFCTDSPIDLDQDAREVSVDASTSGSVSIDSIAETAEMNTVQVALANFTVETKTKARIV